MGEGIKTNFHKLWECLLERDYFLLTTHFSPDPDGWGSQLGLDYLLRKHGKDCLIFNNDLYLGGEPQKHEARVYTSEQDFDHSLLEGRTIVSLDNSSLNRIGTPADYIKEDKSNLIIVDHHDGMEADNQSIFIFPRSSATSEIVYILYNITNTEPPIEIAEALYRGLVMDTGHFRYAKTSPITHRVAARLLACKVKPAHVSEDIYMRFSLSRLYARQLLYPTMQLSEDKQIVYFALHIDNLQVANVRLDDLDGLLDECFEVKEIKIALLFTQREQKLTRVNCRARTGVDMLSIVQKFDGGGHKTACGMHMPMKLDVAINEVLPLFKDLL